jgi:hypothetical protein
MQLFSTLHGPVHERIFTKTVSLFPAPNSPIMIVSTQHASRSPFPIAFQARLPAYVLKMAHIPAIKLRCAKVSQPDSLLLFANLDALFCTRLKALI